MIIYFDTSALVKFYVKESESDRVRNLISNKNIVLASHEIAYIEIRSCFARLNREVIITDKIYETLKQEFEVDWQNYLRVKIDDPLIKRAAEFTDAFALRAYDSVHLAAAQGLALSIDTNLIFACFDQKLNRAASVLGLETI